MKQYSKRKEYEKAGELRDKIVDLKYLGEKIDFEYNESSQEYIARRKKLLESNFKDLKIELGLKTLNRIECYDISNIQGKDAYASMVVAENGEIKRGEYRIFKIRSLDTPNDMHMLKEAITRRLNPKHSEKYNSLPNLILIDGGKAQLSVLESHIPEDIYLLGITKGRKYKRKGGRLLDEFWFMNRENKKVEKLDIFNKDLLIDLRDEAHRFAILHHRKARRRNQQISEIDKITGVGQKSRVKLLKVFKDIEGIKKASLEEINEVLNNRRISKNIYEYFRK
jgi:excinuclease ABC subunit C